MQEIVKKYIREGVSLGVSIGIHCLLLTAFQTKTLLQNIVIEEIKPPKEENINVEAVEETIQDNEEIDLFIDLDSFKDKPKPKLVPKKIIKKKVEKIDSRGIYKVVKNSPGKKDSDGEVVGSGSGTKLEINGWMWDTKPVVNDNSSEVGKIVFEFKIDDLGYVIGIKTLEKTVSNHVEKVYRDAVLKLTFKKIDNIAPQEETIGRITFTIVYSE